MNSSCQYWSQEFSLVKKNFFILSNKLSGYTGFGSLDVHMIHIHLEATKPLEKLQKTSRCKGQKALLFRPQFVDPLTFKTVKSQFD